MLAQARDIHRAELDKAHALPRQEILTKSTERDALQQWHEQTEISQQHNAARGASRPEETDEVTARLATELAQTSSKVHALQEELATARQGLSASREKDQEIAQLSEELIAVRRARNDLTEKLALTDELASRQLRRSEQRSTQREKESQHTLARYQSVIEELQDQLRTATQINGEEYQQMYNRQGAELHALRSELKEAKTAVALTAQQMSLLLALVPVSADGSALTDRAMEYEQRPDVVKLLEMLRRRQCEVGKQVAEAARTHPRNPQPETREILLEHIWAKFVLSSRLPEPWLAAALAGRL